MHCYMLNIEALNSEDFCKKFFPHYKSKEVYDPKAMANLTPGACMVGTIYVGDH